jgi:hypothetical protein
VMAIGLRSDRGCPAIAVIAALESVQVIRLKVPD